MPDSEVNFDPEVDLDASGRHAEIRNEDGRYLLIDTGSRNGTWLNGQRIKHVALDHGDEIEFGRGGPRVQVTSVRPRRASREPTVPMSLTTPRRPPKFDPLAMPVTTATRLEDLVGEAKAAQLLETKPLANQGRSSSRPHGRSSKTLALWGAATVVLLCALGAILSTLW